AADRVVVVSSSRAMRRCSRAGRQPTGPATAPLGLVAGADVDPGSDGHGVVVLGRSQASNGLPSRARAVVESTLMGGFRGECDQRRSWSRGSSGTRPCTNTGN